MHYMRATIFLAIVSFINLAMAVIFNLVRTTLWEQLRWASNLTNVSAQVEPHLGNIELVFWFMFIFSAVGAIIWYILGSHGEEYEEYRG